MIRSANPLPNVARSDEAVLVRLRANDSDAFDEIVVDYYEALLRAAVSYLGSRESGEEIVQDVLLNVWRNRAGLSAPAGLRLYLYAAVRNRALSLLRHQQSERRLDRSAKLDASALPFVRRAEPTDERARVAELDVAIQHAIARLPARCREAFVLSRQHEMTHAEIARVMGTSVKTVQEQVGRALKSLRHALADWLD